MQGKYRTYYTIIHSQIFFFFEGAGGYGPHSAVLSNYSWLYIQTTPGSLRELYEFLGIETSPAYQLVLLLQSHYLF